MSLIILNFNTLSESRIEKYKYNNMMHSPESPFFSSEGEEKVKEHMRENIKCFIFDVNRLFKKRYELSVSEDDLPDIEINPQANHASYSGGEDEYGRKLNVIEIKRDVDILDGSVIGEEVGHFYRRQYRPDSEEILTDEFFGWMGRRLFYEATLKDDGTSDFFPSEGLDIRREFLGTKTQVMERLNNLRKEIKELIKQYQAETDNFKRTQIFDEGRNVVERREDILTHYRGYEFAAKVDLSKITNWKQFFSMSDKEVRKRFFTKDQNYSGL